MKYLIFILLTFFFIAFSGSSASATTKIPDINTILMKSTVKISGQHAYGTAFVLGKYSQKTPRPQKYILVTAAHVLSDIKGEEAVLFFRKKTGTTYTKIAHTIAIRKKDTPLWTQHPDVDVAAMYVSVPAGIDMPVASTRLLATNDILNRYDIAPGTELHALGFPFGKESHDSGFPVLRSGKIASYPLIPVEQTKTFLLDFKIFSGNSGGPVYFHDPDWHKRGEYSGFKQQEVQILMGLVSSQVVVPEKIESNISLEYTVRNHQLGIAVIVHAAYIRETLKILEKKQE